MRPLISLVPSSGHQLAINPLLGISIPENASLLSSHPGLLRIRSLCFPPSQLPWLNPNAGTTARKCNQENAFFPLIRSLQFHGTIRVQVKDWFLRQQMYCLLCIYCWSPMHLRPPMVPVSTPYISGTDPGMLFASYAADFHRSWRLLVGTKQILHRKLSWYPSYVYIIHLMRRISHSWWHSFRKRHGYVRNVVPHSAHCPLMGCRCYKPWRRSFLPRSLESPVNF
jgi:hypothetical protein